MATISSLQRHALSVMQAMLGVISPNVRMIAVTETRGAIIVKFVLEVESKCDRNEIEDSETEFEALYCRPIDYRFEIVIDSKDIEWPDSSWVVVYRRREVCFADSD